MHTARHWLASSSPPLSGVKLTDPFWYQPTAGFIGRFLALYLHENNLASEVRLVDKVLPQLAWLAPEFEEACSKDKFVQADASRERT